MVQRWAASVIGLGALGLLCACSSGDGAPTVSVRNELDGLCIVATGFLGNVLSEPIGTGGQTAPHEVSVGTDIAYAIAMPPGASGCVSPIVSAELRVFVTRARLSTEPGQHLLIPISTETAVELKKKRPDDAQEATWCRHEWGEAKQLFGMLPSPGDGACTPTH